VRSKQPQLDVDAIILRMRQVFGVTYETELAAALGLSKAAPSNWRQRNSPPYEICTDIAREKGVSLDWLIFGIGDMRLGGRAEAPQDPEHLESLPAHSPAAERVSQFVYWWHVNRTQDEMIWLEQQFKRAVPEYGDWLVTQSPD
jgi:transcriptional regulator with XRE-family HTH domain